jgi:hypothetical protein
LDPRQAWKVVYSLAEVPLLVLCGTRAGTEDLLEIRRWGRLHLHLAIPPFALAGSCFCFRLLALGQIEDESACLIADIHKVEDIDSTRMVIRVEQGKGRKDRCVMLSPYVFDLLRAWSRAARPRGWLFPGAIRSSQLRSILFEDRAWSVLHSDR